MHRDTHDNMRHESPAARPAHRSAPRPQSRVAVPATLLVAIAGATPFGPWAETLAQEGEMRRASANFDRQFNGTERAALAKLGIDIAAIENCTDVDGLWRAVRQLALRGHLSEPTQQRLLRRIWAIDPDVRNGGFVDSTFN